jgi:hypothetical protein
MTQRAVGAMLSVKIASINTVSNDGRSAKQWLLNTKEASVKIANQLTLTLFLISTTWTLRKKNSVGTRCA